MQSAIAAIERFFKASNVQHFVGRFMRIKVLDKPEYCLRYQLYEGVIESADIDFNKQCLFLRLKEYMPDNYSIGHTLQFERGKEGFSIDGRHVEHIESIDLKRML